jgi:hypothetical protein
MSRRIPDRATAIRCLNQIPKLLAIYEPESPKLREDVTDSIELLSRPNDAKKMIAEIELLTEALKISCRHQLIVEALSLPECDEMIEQYDDSDDQELMDSYIERAKQSIEGE